MEELTMENYIPFLGLTHFIPCNYDLTLNDLELFLRRSGGIRCKDCQRGMDVVIPILFVKQNPTTEGPDHVVSFWSIQSKNRISDTMTDQQVQAGLSFSNCFNPSSQRPNFPYLAMHLSLRPSDNIFQRHIPKSSSDGQQVTVRCQGLQSMPYFQNPNAVDVVTLLENILITRNDATEFVPEPLQPLLRAMTPLTDRPPPPAKSKCPRSTAEGNPCKSSPAGKCLKSFCSSHCRSLCKCSSK